MSQQPWKLRRATEADLPRIQEFSRREWGSQSLAHPDYWRWLVMENPGGRTQFWMATVEDELVGIITMAPVRARVGNCEVLSFAGMNAIVRSDSRRQGVATALGRQVFEECPGLGVAFSFAPLGPKIETAGLAMGYEVIGPAEPLMLKPLNVTALLAHRGIESRSIQWLAETGYKLASPVLQRRRGSPLNSHLTMAEVTRFDTRFDQFWKRIRHNYHTLLVRDSAFLQWRYMDVPFKTARCLAVSDIEGEIVAFVVYRNTSLDGTVAGLILDLLIEPSIRGRDAGTQLLIEVDRQFEHAGVAISLCYMLRHTNEIEVLRDRGYIPCPRSLEPYPRTMTYKLATDQLSGSDFVPRDRWFFTFADVGIDSFSI